MPGKLDWSGVEEGLEFVGASHQEIDARQSSATIECSISANPASVFPIVSNLISSYCLEAMLVCGIVGNFHSNCRLDRGGCNLGKHGAPEVAKIIKERKLPRVPENPSVVTTLVSLGRFQIQT